MKQWNFCGRKSRAHCRRAGRHGPSPESTYPLPLLHIRSFLGLDNDDGPEPTRNFKLFIINHLGFHLPHAMQLVGPQVNISLVDASTRYTRYMETYCTIPHTLHPVRHYGLKTEGFSQQCDMKPCIELLNNFEHLK